jgi:hypothetical protein
VPCPGWAANRRSSSIPPRSASSRMSMTSSSRPGCRSTSRSTRERFRSTW